MVNFEIAMSNFLKEIRKGQENLKASSNYNLVPSPPPKLKILILGKNCRKIEIKTFPCFTI